MITDWNSQGQYCVMRRSHGETIFCWVCSPQNATNICHSEATHATVPRKTRHKNTRIKHGGMWRYQKAELHGWWFHIIEDCQKHWINKIQMESRAIYLNYRDWWSASPRAWSNLTHRQHTWEIALIFGKGRHHVVPTKWHFSRQNPRNNQNIEFLSQDP